MIPALLVILVLGAAALVYRRWAREVPILMYHRVRDLPGDRLSVPPAVFDRQMAYLHARGYQTITLDALHAHLAQGAPLPPRPVVLTFDDAYEDVFTHALPILRRYGMTAAVFAISDWIGAENGWEAYPGQPRCRTMTWEQLRAWQEAGMTVGSHTVSHPSLPTLADAQITREVRDSKQALEERTGTSVGFLCYPYGDFDPRVLAAAEEAGYRAALAIFASTSPWSNHPFALRRIPVTPRDTGRAFAMKVSPLHVLSIALRALERRIKRGRRAQYRTTHSSANSSATATRKDTW